MCDIIDLAEENSFDDDCGVYQMDNRLVLFDEDYNQINREVASIKLNRQLQYHELVRLNKINPVKSVVIHF